MINSEITSLVNDMHFLVPAVSEKATNAAIEDFYLSCRRSNVQIAKGEWFGESQRCFRLGFGHMTIEKLDITLNVLTEIQKIRLPIIKCKTASTAKRVTIVGIKR